ncbi:S41 family peptidase [Cytobacillus sp. IB215665]|uniref:S41 family peptidase n=1 Tax=Cytobacillus sp. IB215665 TaxID=3097357 RepID=UPI002A0AEE66|nr:S41 family peptidase [Cytobacillus sp. IB215665]MDX8365655.1 S41 family peptidase [Cytobacillus sp. IB215665]
MSKKILVIIALVGILLFAVYSFIQGTDKPTNKEETNSVVDLSISIEQQVENLHAFSRLYGYIRYFHPSDEAEQIDWEKFAIYGTGYVVKAKNTGDLKEKLEELFLPIAPTIQIYQEGEEVRDTLNIESEDSSLNYVAWQHFGKARNKFEGGVYKKEKIIFNETSSSEKLFDSLPTVGEKISETINRSLRANIPLVLYTDGEKTLGSTEETMIELDNLVEEINKVKADPDAEALHTRIAGVTILWNDIQHFYPYFEEVNADWLKELPSFIEVALETKNKEDYADIIDYMTEKLADGHISGNLQRWKESYRLPFTVDIAEDQLVITSTYQDTHFKVGDIIMSIDEKPTYEYLLQSQARISGSPQTKELLSIWALEYGKMDETLLLEIDRNGKSLSLEGSYGYANGLSNFPIISQHITEIKEGIYYVNTLKIDYDVLIPHLDSLAKAKGIIFDMRGRPGPNIWQLVSHLTDRTVKGPLLAIEQIIYPDHKKLAGYNTTGTWTIEPQEPRFEGEFVFLTNARAISYPETILGVIEDNNLGYIVGQPTAGANGDITEINLPGHENIWFTGLKVVKSDGSQHHFIGIEPTHVVERTIEGIKAGKDEYIEKAIQIINQ